MMYLYKWAGTRPRKGCALRRVASVWCVNDALLTVHERLDHFMSITVING